MKHHKIINRPDGSRVRITAELTVQYGTPYAQWSFIVHTCAAGKRTWTTPVNHDDYAWRKLITEERRNEDKRRSLTLASAEEVHETMLKLWQKMKPDLSVVSVLEDET